LNCSKINERQTLEFRAEFFNVFNHPQFAIQSYPFLNQGPAFSSGQLGIINSTSVAPRLVQLALKYQFDLGSW
jgi:hypothetical protein